MFCIKCGKEIPDGSRFCPECGASLVTQHSGKSTRKLTKNQKKIIGGISILSVIAVIVIIVLVTRKPTIDLDKYVSVKFDGYNTVGTAEVSYDVKKFSQDYADLLIKRRNKYLYKNRDYLTDEEFTTAHSLGKNSFASDLFDYFVYGKLNKDKKLSNGEKITYSWDFNYETIERIFGCKVKCNDISFETKGLKKVTEIDPFEGIELTYEGVSPNVRVSITKKPTGDIFEDIDYEFDYDSDLKNGDTINLSVDCDEDSEEDANEYYIENYGKKLNSFVKTYTVENADEYCQSAKDIPEDTLKSMQTKAEQLYKEKMKQNWGDNEHLNSFTYIGNYYFHTDSEFSSNHNDIYLVYKANITDSEKINKKKHSKTLDAYWYISYKDLIKSADGTVTVDLDDNTVVSDTFDVYITENSGRLWYYGYQSLDELKKEICDDYGEEYTLEENF